MAPVELEQQHLLIPHPPEKKTEAGGLDKSLTCDKRVPAPTKACMSEAAAGHLRDQGCRLSNCGLWFSIPWLLLVGSDGEEALTPAVPLQPEGRGLKLPRSCWSQLPSGGGLCSLPLGLGAGRGGQVDSPSESVVLCGCSCLPVRGGRVRRLLEKRREAL